MPNDEHPAPSAALSKTDPDKARHENRLRNSGPHRWKPGQSGNPGGRPKGLDKRIRELVDFDAITLAMEDIALGRQPRGKAGELLLHAEIKTSDRIHAAQLLYDRGHGRAKQAIEIAGTLETGGVGSLQLDGLDDAALELLERTLVTALGGEMLDVIDAHAIEAGDPEDA